MRHNFLILCKIIRSRRREIQFLGTFLSLSNYDVKKNVTENRENRLQLPSETLNWKNNISPIIYPNNQNYNKVFKKINNNVSENYLLQFLTSYSNVLKTFTKNNVSIHFYGEYFSVNILI